MTTQWSRGDCDGEAGEGGGRQGCLGGENGGGRRD